MKVKAALDRLVSAIKKTYPQYAMPETITGLPQEEIDQLYVSLPFASDELEELFAIYDFACVNLFPPYYLAAPDEMAATIDTQIVYYDEVEELMDRDRVGWVSSTHNVCKTDQSWRNKWIPLGTYQKDTIFLDMDPAEGGVAGQVVASHERKQTLELLGYSLAHWMERIANHLENEKPGKRYACSIESEIEAPEERPA